MSRSYPVTLRASANQAAGTETGIAGAGVFDLTSVSRLDSFVSLVAQLNVSVAGTDVGDTLDVYIDTSFDGGTTYVNMGHFTQVLGNGGVKTFVMAFKADNPGATAVYDVTSNAAAGATRQIGFGGQVRYRSTVVDANSNGGFTYDLKLFFK
jgi:hypothetical protein